MPAKTVAVELVEKAGINVETLLNLLISNASAELTTFYYYTILRVNLIGLEGEGLKQIAEDARIEDRNHFEALVPRIYELGDKLPQDMVEFHNISACPPARLPADQPPQVARIHVIRAECAVCQQRLVHELSEFAPVPDARGLAESPLLLATQNRFRNQPSNGLLVDLVPSSSAVGGELESLRDLKVSSTSL